MANRRDRDTRVENSTADSVKNKQSESLLKSKHTCNIFEHNIRATKRTKYSTTNVSFNRQLNRARLIFSLPPIFLVADSEFGQVFSARNAFSMCKEIEQSFFSIPMCCKVENKNRLLLLIPSLHCTFSTEKDERE